MLKSKLKAFFIISCLILLSNCDGKDKSLTSKIDHIENIVDELPDSAMHLLENIVPTDITDTGLKHKHILLNIKAKDKTYQDITHDSAIISTKHYYIRHNDAKYAPWATFYCGRFYNEQKLNAAAMTEYLQARDLAAKGKDYRLKAFISFFIGELNYKQMLYIEAIPFFKEAAENFEKSGQTYNYINSIIFVGNSFLITKDNDSAFIYYNDALKIAKEHNDTISEIDVKQNIAVAYRAINEPRKSVQYLRETLPYTRDSLAKARLYFNIGQAYNAMSSDSVKYYALKSLDLIPTKDDGRLTIALYKLLSNGEEKEGNLKKALDYYKKYTEQVFVLFENREQGLIEQSKKRYEYQLTQNINNQELIEKQWAIVILLIIVFVLICFAFVIYRKYAKQKNELLESKQKIYQMKDLAGSYDEQSQSLRNVLLRQFNIMKKSALLEGFLREEEKDLGVKYIRKINEIVYEKESFDWEQLYNAMNDLVDGFFDKMHERYSVLDEAEFRICCLTFAELSNTEIGLMLKLSTNTIYAKKTIIRKKIGIGGYGNLTEFIINEIKKEYPEIKTPEIT